MELHVTKRIPLIKQLDPKDITSAIKSVMLSSFPSNLEVTQASVESRKEFKDREVVVNALLHLMESSTPIYYSNEAKISVNKHVNTNLVHGDLDLLIGERIQSSGFPSVQVSIHEDKFKICNPELSETKCKGKALAKTGKKKKPKQATTTTTLDLSTTVQPVLQVIVLGQLLQGRSSPAQHLNNFYMNRNKIRPFIYFPSHDVMLTTNRSYVWRKDDQLMLRGCILIAILLRFQRLGQLPPQLWKDESVTRTNFMQASMGEKLNIQESYHLRLTHPSSKKNILDAETLEEEFELEGTDYHPNTLPYLKPQILCKGKDNV